jgi:spore germination cell wall hydrolase CwlJ-like protein
VNKFLSKIILCVAFLIPSSGDSNTYNRVNIDVEQYYPYSVYIIENNEPELNPEWVQCLAENIYYESRGEPILGQIAVAAVTINRFNDPRFPNDICEVIHQRVNRRCQFSWVCMRLRPPHGEAWNRSVELATEYLLGIHDDPTNGAIFFSNPRYTSFGRNVRRAIAIGNHRFW